MNGSNLRPALCSVLLFLLAGASAAADRPPTASLADALSQGKVSLNVRARYEGVDQTGLKDADALTLRTRLGFTTAAYQGLKAMVEFENITSPDGDAYNQAGLNPGGAGRAVVVDPEGSEVNQVWLAYSAGKTTTTLGRQRLVLDNARFVGDVGWRQNMQTFDGLTLVNKSLDKTTLTYGYLSRINRIFGDDHAQGNWDSDSHVLNANYEGFKAGTLTGYAYLLDFDNAAAQSNATYGVSFAGATPLTDAVKFTYRAEYAAQSDYGSSALNYSTDYYTLELGLAGKPGAIAVGYEKLGSDNGVSFRTPLATLHAFNGWADMFLATPANGIKDTYVKASAGLPGGFGLLAFYHKFESARLGLDYGSELDIQLTRKLAKNVTGAIKYTGFDPDSTGFAKVNKFWLQADFSY
ncbi:MAG: hypothetical protein QG602_2108 [Verrucomicrobiota bacterium]|nr:hypothetical protein [Verrucomicrobiota bacterium]